MRDTYRRPELYAFPVAIVLEYMTQGDEILEDPWRDPEAVQYINN